MLTEHEKKQVCSCQSWHLQSLVEDKERFIKHLHEDKPSDVDWQQWALELEEIVSLAKSELARRGELPS